MRTYERLIILCATQLTYEDALFYLEEMKVNAFLRTLAIYDAIVKKCVTVGDTQHKLVLEEMEQFGYAVRIGATLQVEYGGGRQEG